MRCGTKYDRFRLVAPSFDNVALRRGLRCDLTGRQLHLLGMLRLELRIAGVCKNVPKCRSKHHLAGDDYQFLQRSVIPSYHFQKSLRRLPIPKLADTCNRFLASAKVILSDAQYKQTEAVVRSFEKSEGQA
ncbi:hypothetical protein ANCCEY_11227 [Ancylostoma ceylanicum]|uniref:Choline/carnitine acyltransferase domain-containing protein n=1 Tax=Ancylostoma ceylanicum TaxID=53326 RepID=A0A0D6LI98_9BILA|nr:hypothetical protein ANCCEY_11227 [Ancylostoma ceylanicum]